MKKVIAALITMVFFLTPFAAQAGMVSTQELVDPASQWMSNPLLVDKMLEMGVEPQEVQARIDAMTPGERAQLNASLEDMPAGQDILGLAFLVFLVFVITDVIGATDVFPFINSVNK